MKRVILVLAMLLIATPAFATVTITATQTPETGQVVISYSSDEASVIRGLALDVIVTQVGSSLGAPVITDVTNYQIGETTDEGTRGFGIFPSTVTIAENGEVTDAGVPVSPQTKYPSDTKAGLDTNSVTLEMASLYDMDDIATLAPASSGTLCTLTVDHDCDLSITTNNIRGGVVLNSGKYSQDPCEATRLVVDMAGATGVQVLFEEPPTAIISGSVGTLDGVTMAGLPGSPVTSGGGAYSVTVDNGWSGTVTPTLAGYTFNPTEKTYSNVTSDQTAQNYTAYPITPTVSGTISLGGGTLDGVTMSGLPGSPVTAGGGIYSTTVVYGWTGTVTPSKAGYTFVTTEKTYSNVTADQTAQNYTATGLTYTISGSVGTLNGVTMGGLPGSPVTSGGGLYSATVVYGWSGTVTPSRTGWTFSPANKTYSNVTANQTAKNYTILTGCNGCRGDISGATPGVPDGFISSTDISYLALTLNTYKNSKTGKIASTDTAHYIRCGDVSGITPGVPDDFISSTDISYLALTLNTYKNSKTGKIACPHSY